MSTSDHPPYEPHLVLREFSLPPGREWLPKPSGWMLVHINQGQGYWLQDQTRTELAAGTVVLRAGLTRGRFLASQLTSLSFSFFSVIPDRLAGLMTLGEQNFLKQAAARPDLAFKVLAPANAVATRMGELVASPNRAGLAFRLAMLQLLVGTLGPEFNQLEPELDSPDARHRLRLFLQATPQDTLLEISFEKLAQLTHCTARHLSRIFQEVVGMSFSEKRAEIRLARARELLASSESKVVEIAMESGYKSLSLFNLMFTRRFGVSPGQWRKKFQAGGTKGDRNQHPITPSLRQNKRRPNGNGFNARQLVKP